MWLHAEPFWPIMLDVGANAHASFWPHNSNATWDSVLKRMMVTALVCVALLAVKRCFYARDVVLSCP